MKVGEAVGARDQDVDLAERNHELLEQALRERLGDGNYLDGNVCVLSPAVMQPAGESTRQAVVLRAPDGKDYYVKNPFYGNACIVSEVLSGKLYALSGVGCPDVKLAFGCERFFPEGSFATRRDAEQNQREGVPFLCVASHYNEHYKDLGRFLQEDALPLVQAKHGEKGRDICLQHMERVNHTSYVFRQADQALRALDQQQREAEEGAPLDEEKRAQIVQQKQDAKLVRRNALWSIFEMLPEDIHYEIHKAYAASKWVGNWDFSNFALCNVGLVPSEQREGHYRAFVVDFGNSGIVGFKGLPKVLSHGHANQPAREEDPMPFPIAPEEAQFSDQMPGRTLTAVSSLPRTRPFSQLLKPCVDAETDGFDLTYLRREGARNGLPPTLPKELGGLCDGSYRVGCMSMELLHRTIHRNHVLADDLIPFPAEWQGYRITAEEYCQVMQGRTEQQARAFSGEQTESWMRKFPAKAIIARKEVADVQASFPDYVRYQAPIPRARSADSVLMHR